MLENPDSEIAGTTINVIKISHDRMYNNLHTE